MADRNHSSRLKLGKRIEKRINGRCKSHSPLAIPHPETKHCKSCPKQQKDKELNIPGGLGRLRGAVLTWWTRPATR